MPTVSTPGGFEPFTRPGGRNGVKFTLGVNRVDQRRLRPWAWRELCLEGLAGERGLAVKTSGF